MENHITVPKKHRANKEEAPQLRDQHRRKKHQTPPQSLRRTEATTLLPQLKQRINRERCSWNINYLSRFWKTIKTSLKVRGVIEDGLQVRLQQSNPHKSQGCYQRSFACMTTTTKFPLKVKHVIRHTLCVCLHQSSPHEK